MHCINSGGTAIARPEPIWFGTILFLSQVNAKYTVNSINIKNGGMNMKITDELIEYICELTKLELSAGEKDSMEKDLTDILDYMDKLNGIDTKGVPEMTHPFDEVNKTREDIVTNEDRRDELLANAPDKKGDFFKVFKTVEE